MSASSVQGTISLTASQLRILKRVYQESARRPQTFMLKAGQVDWDVLAAYRLLERAPSVITPDGSAHFDYTLTPLGKCFIKSLEVWS